MATDTEIKPALSAALWKDRWNAWQALMLHSLHMTQEGSLRKSVSGPPAEPRALVGIIALANAALPEDDPRKITREDVLAMEAVYRHIITDMRPGLPAAAIERCYALAAKLDAFLPPSERLP